MSDTEITRRELDALEKDAKEVSSFTLGDGAAPGPFSWWDVGLFHKLLRAARRDVLRRGRWEEGG